MFAIDKILVLVDLSSHSNSLFETSVQLSLKFGADLLIYHASPNLVGENQIVDLQGNFQSQLEECHNFKDLDQNRIQIIIASENFPSGAMLKQVLSDADLVVVGGGRVNSSDIKREKIVNIIDSSYQPVLVVPKDLDRGFKDVRSILYCSSYEDISNNKPLEIIKVFAECYDSEVRVAHVKTHSGKPNNDHVEQSKIEGDFFKPTVNYSYKLIRNNDVIDGISEYIKKKGDNDIVVMIRRKHHIFERIFGKNFTFRMLQRTEIPLLIIKEEQLN